MKGAILILLTLFLLLGGVDHVNAGIINGGFETNDLTGWVAAPSSLVSVQTSVSEVDSDGAFHGPWNPMDGSYFAYMQAGPTNGSYTLLSQTFTANVGDAISLYAFFDTNEPQGNATLKNDDGFVELINAGDNSVLHTLFTKTVNEVGGNGGTDWIYSSYTFTLTGSFKIRAGVRNVDSNSGDSYLGLDAVVLTENPLNVVPEPSSLILLGMAGATFASYFGLRRRKQVGMM